MCSESIIGCDALVIDLLRFGYANVQILSTVALRSVLAAAKHVQDIRVIHEAVFKLLFAKHGSNY